MPVRKPPMLRLPVASPVSVRETGLKPGYSMPEFCTCGAQLPPDARFCHRCGKPQRDEAIAEAALAASQRPAGSSQGLAGAIEAPAPATLNFNNPVALRAGLFAASIAALLCYVPYINWLFVIWLVAAGFLSVFLFRRRTGQILTVRGGARMGWITGVLSFGILTILLTVSILLVATRSGGFAAMYREQVQRMAVQPQDMRQALEILQSPGGVALILLFLVFMIFVITTSACTVGGALGAKVLGKD